MKLYPKHCRDLLLDLGKKVVAMFNRFNVEYIMAGGTLLGAYRNKKFIPWDYDIDFELLPGELNLINLRMMVFYANAHKECGFVCLLQHLPTMVKFIPALSREQIKKMGLNDPNVINPTVDLCITEPRPGGGEHRPCAVNGRTTTTKPGRYTPYRLWNLRGANGGLLVTQRPCSVATTAMTGRRLNSGRGLLRRTQLNVTSRK